MWADMTPLNSLADGRVFQTQGVSTATQDHVGAAFEIPSGALVHDVEVYYNANTNTTLSVAAWSSGIANVANVIASTQLGPFSGASMHVTNLSVPRSVNGPFPHGTMLVPYVDTLANQSIQVNGFRVGFTRAPLSTVLFGNPTRVYDSRNHAPLRAGQSRTIALSAHVPVGTNGAQYVVSALNTHGSGSLSVGAAGSSLAIPAVSWHGTGARVSGQVTSTVDAAHQIAVRSNRGSGNCDVAVDLVGYLV